jgi:hypothetical protein
VKTNEASPELLLSVLLLLLLLDVVVAADVLEEVSEVDELPEPEPHPARPSTIEDTKNNDNTFFFI